MAETRPGAPPRSVLVSDFDGTMTDRDFYILVRDELLPPGAPDFWSEYRAGRLTHFEALRAIFAAARPDEPALLGLVERMGLDPGLAGAVGGLRAAGWEVVVVSAGCDWYIRRLLEGAGVELTVHANPGRFEPGRGLLMARPEGSPFFSPTIGVDKRAVTERALREADRVAFAGDGYPDIDAARLVPDDLRFARGALAEALAAEGLPFRTFDRWSDVARDLLARDAGGAHP